MKQLETYDVTLGGNKFYIRPFAAFKAAKMSGELAQLVSPLLAGLVPLATSAKEEGSDTVDLGSIDLAKAAPAISSAFSCFSGDKLEAVLKHLLIDGENVSVQLAGEARPQKLTMDLTNEIFCGEVQDMFLLAFEVIKVNYAGFFAKFTTLFGRVNKERTEKTA